MVLLSGVRPCSPARVSASFHCRDVWMLALQLFDHQMFPVICCQIGSGSGFLQICLHLCCSPQIVNGKVSLSLSLFPVILCVRLVPRFCEVRLSLSAPRTVTDTARCDRVVSPTMGSVNSGDDEVVCVADALPALHFALRSSARWCLVRDPHGRCQATPMLAFFPALRRRKSSFKPSLSIAWSEFLIHSCLRYHASWRDSRRRWNSRWSQLLRHS